MLPGAKLSPGFDIAFDRLMGIEGGYSNRADDPGGETNWGISKRSYPNVDIKALTRDAAKAIYLRDFWTRGRMEQYDAAIAFQTFDIAVNSGIETAVRMLQRAAGVADDGHVGPITLSAIKAKSRTDMLMLIVAERLEFWRKLSNWPAAGKGWAGRAATDLRYAAADS
jgi:lysozyme family protein